MGYLHINNLYRDQVILMFRECYALEKIHGTSAHITFNFTSGDFWSAKFFSGGESYTKFVSLFDQVKLQTAVKDLDIPIDKEITVFGEAYGGSQQGMSHTYGKELKFIVFDIKIGDNFLSVPDAEDVAKKLGLEFVHYTKVPLVKWGESGNEVVTDLRHIDAERDMPSVQAVRNGVSTPEAFMKGEGPGREGVVLRPLIEMTLNNGQRVIVKHKGDKFKETATPRPVVDPSKLKVLSDATAVANEWTTNTRLEHILQKIQPARLNGEIPEFDMSQVPQIIKAMIEDVLREGEGEIVVSESVKKAIGKKAIELFKGFLNSQISK